MQEKRGNGHGYFQMATNKTIFLMQQANIQDTAFRKGGKNYLLCTPQQVVSNIGAKKPVIMYGDYSYQ